MRTVLFSFATFVALIGATQSISAIEGKVVPEAPPSTKSSRCYPIRYASAQEASEKLAVVIRGPKLVVNERENSITATGSELHHAQIAKILEVVDYSPAKVSLSCSLVRVRNGERTTIAKPQLITLDGQSATISVSSGDETFEVEITPSVTLPETTK